MKNELKIFQNLTGLLLQIVVTEDTEKVVFTTTYRLCLFKWVSGSGLNEVCFLFRNDDDHPNQS